MDRNGKQGKHTDKKKIRIQFLCIRFLKEIGCKVTYECSMWGQVFKLYEEMVEITGQVLVPFIYTQKHKSNWIKAFIPCMLYIKKTKQ